MTNRSLFASLSLALSLAAPAVAVADDRPMSPPGNASANIGGKWSTGEHAKYEGGKWLDVTYGRPLLRGRKDVFGAGADYGKKVNAGASVWRVGANQTTKLKTEVTLSIGGKKLAPGEYDLFVELKEGAWTLIVSSQPAADKYTPGAKDKIWGSYGYDAKFDVVRAPMKMEKSDASIEQFTIDFVDVSDKSVTLLLSWDHTMAAATFGVE